MECSNANTSFSKIRIVKNLSVISLSFLLIFTAYNGLSMLQTTMNKEEGVGTFSQAVIYVTFGLSSLLLYRCVVKKLGTKNTQLLGLIMYLPYIAANFYPSWITLVPSAVIIGIGCTFLWGAQCTYFNECSVLYTEITNASANVAPNREVTYTFDKEGAELSAIVLKQKVEGNQNTQENPENSPSKGLPPDIYIVGPESGCLGEENAIKKKEKVFGLHTNPENSLEIFPPEDLSSDICVANPVPGCLGEENAIKKKEKVFGLHTNPEKSLEISPLSPDIDVANPVPGCLKEEKAVKKKENAFWLHKNPENSPETSPPEGLSPDICVANPVPGCLGEEKAIKKKENAFGLHTSNNVRNKNNQKSGSLNSINALFFGFHGSAYYSAQVWSNLISFYVLSSGKMANYNITSNCSCGAEFCNSVQECVDTRIEEVPADVRCIYTGVCVACGIVAVLLIWLFVDHMDRPQGRTALPWNQIFDTIKFIKNKEQVLLIPLTICTSMIQAFYAADFTKSYIACAWSTSHVGLVTVFYGVASTLSSIISGFLIRLFGRKIVLVFCITIKIVCLVLLYLWTPDPHQPYLLYLAGGIFGFISGILYSQTKALYGVFFQGKEETAFSSYNIYVSIGWMLPFAYSEFFCTSVKICILFIIACLGLIGYLVAERSFSLRNKQIELSK